VIFLNNNRLLLIALLVGLFTCDAITYAESSHEWVTDAVVADNVEFCIFFSEAVNAEVSYHIYLPDEYHNSPSKRFPVLFWLHGSGGGLVGIPPLSSFFDNAIVGGHIPPMLIVFPNGLPNGMWCDSKDGSTPIESMLMNDLIPHIDQTYRTIGSSNSRIIEGFSMGGYGAGRIGVRRKICF
jgi:enterochelin esterase-like enzyme